ncbi:hypothetical protein GQ457_04G020970 [Hibiscus cannabinus]
MVTRNEIEVSKRGELQKGNIEGMLDRLEAKCHENPGYMNMILKLLVTKDESFIGWNQSSLESPSIQSSSLVVHGIVNGLHVKAKEVGSGVDNVFDELSMRTNNNLVSHMNLIPEEADVGMNKQPLPVLALDENLNKMGNETKAFDPILNKIQTVSIMKETCEVKMVTTDDRGTHAIKSDIVCELGNLFDNKRNMSDEMLTKVNVALSTVGNLVHLSRWVSEYNLCSVLIPSFDPGESDATPIVIDTVNMSQIRIRASSRYWYARIDKKRQRPSLYKYRIVILYLVKSHATAIAVSWTSNGETTQISQSLEQGSWIDAWSFNNGRSERKKKKLPPTFSPLEHKRIFPSRVGQVQQKNAMWATKYLLPLSFMQLVYSAPRNAVANQLSWVFPHLKRQLTQEPTCKDVSSSQLPSLTPDEHGANISPPSW